MLKLSVKASSSSSRMPRPTVDDIGFTMVLSMDSDRYHSIAPAKNLSLLFLICPASRGAGDPPYIEALAFDFSYTEDLSDGIGYLLGFTSRRSSQSWHAQWLSGFEPTRHGAHDAPPQSKRGRPCEQPRDGNESSEGRFLYCQLPFTAFRAFTLHALKRHQLARAGVPLGVAHAPG